MISMMKYLLRRWGGGLRAARYHYELGEGWSFGGHMGTGSIVKDITQGVLMREQRGVKVPGHRMLFGRHGDWYGGRSLAAHNEVWTIIMEPLAS